MFLDRLPIGFVRLDRNDALSSRSHWISSVSRRDGGDGVGCFREGDDSKTACSGIILCSESKQTSSKNSPFFRTPAYEDESPMY